MIVNIPYTIYSEDDIRVKLKDNERLIVGNIDHLKYGLIFNPSWSIVKGLDYTTAHLQFHALSGGWKSFTSTGYLSHFICFERSIELANCNGLQT